MTTSYFLRRILFVPFTAFFLAVVILGTAGAVPVDFSETQCFPTGAETVEIHGVRLEGLSGTVWGRFAWAPQELALKLTDAGMDTTPAHFLGTWGGEHLEMTVEAAGTRLDFDCAAGTIDAPLVAADDGVYSLPGIFTPGTGGPVQENQVPDNRPARYTGWTDGQTMHLLIVLTETGDLVGPFALERGARGRVFHCY